MKVGIIGNLGKVGRKREKIIRDRYNHKVKGFDISLSKNLKEYGDWIGFINKFKPDALFISVPHTLTTDMVVYALNQNIHVFAEKPPGICLGDVVRMSKALGIDTKLKFGFNHRYYKHIQLAKLHILCSDELGKVQWLRGAYGKINMENWRRDKNLGGKGILLSQGIHMVDLVRYLSGCEFDKVKSFTSHFTKNWYEDNVFALLQSKTGITASIHSSCVMGRNTFQLDIGMEGGLISLSGLITSTKSFGFPEQISISSLDDMTFYGNPVQTVTKFGIDTSWEQEVVEFFDCIKNEKDIIHGNISDAYEVMKLVDKVYKDGENIQ